MNTLELQAIVAEMEVALNSDLYQFPDLARRWQAKLQAALTAAQAGEQQPVAMTVRIDKDGCFEYYPTEVLVGLSSGEYPLYASPVVAQGWQPIGWLEKKELLALRGGSMQDIFPLPVDEEENVVLVYIPEPPANTGDKP